MPRGRAAGITWFLPEERDFKYKDQLESELAVAFGGRVAEELIFNRISTGAAADIKQATELAQRMIRNWGMSNKLGPLSFDQGDEQIFLGREIAQHRDYSEDTAQKIDTEIYQLISGAYENAKKVINENLDILHALAEELLEKETVLGSEFDEIIKKMRPGIELSTPDDDYLDLGSDSDSNSKQPDSKSEDQSDDLSDAAEEDTSQTESSGKTQDDDPEPS